MTAAQNARDRRWLRQLAQAVARELDSRNKLPDVILKAPSRVVTETNTSGGWYASLGHVRGDRNSELQLWFDRWPSPTTRKLCVCYKGTRTDQIRRTSAAGSRLFGTAIRLDDRGWHDDKEQGYVHLTKPLPLTAYGRPIVELYERNQSWSFYGVYFRQTPIVTRAPKRQLVHRAARFLEGVTKAVVAQMTTSTEAAGKVYPAVENRQRVAEHLRRERSQRLAAKAKLRDGYTCQICDLNFEEAYGRLGRGFAEAHHRMALSTLRPKVETQLSDLLTVCSNCHRMLHKMQGTRSDVSVLRRAVISRR